MDYLADTTLLIDLQRELRLGEGKAHACLSSKINDTLYISVINVAEFASGISAAEEIKAKRFLESFIILQTNNTIAWRYGQIFQNLKNKSITVGSNDLWIAATCLEYGTPLITRNKKDFENIVGLEIIGY